LTLAPEKATRRQNGQAATEASPWGAAYSQASETPRAGLKPGGATCRTHRGLAERTSGGTASLAGPNIHETLSYCARYLSATVFSLAKKEGGWLAGKHGEFNSLRSEKTRIFVKTRFSCIGQPGKSTDLPIRPFPALAGKSLLPVPKRGQTSRRSKNGKTGILDLEFVRATSGQQTRRLETDTHGRPEPTSRTHPAVSACHPSAPWARACCSSKIRRVLQAKGTRALPRVPVSIEGLGQMKQNFTSPKRAFRGRLTDWLQNGGVWTMCEIRLKRRPRADSAVPLRRR